jgi:hypothetical protein
MKTQIILSKVYRSSSLVIVPLILLVCLMFKWHVYMITIAMVGSIVISSPATIALHFMMWLSQKRTLERGFLWMVLFASIPLLSLIVACLFADYVPGKVWFLLLLGMLSGYIGILSNGISVAQFFNSNKDEREENNTID